MSVLTEKLRSYVKPDGSVAHRPIKEQIYMSYALELAKQATCDRLKVGAVFTDANMSRVVCAGYNGSYSGGPNGCISAEPGACGDVHAEVTAVSQSMENLDGCICFVTTACCRQCSIVLINRKISKVVYLNDYRLNEGLDILRNAGVEVVKYDELPG